MNVMKVAMVTTGLGLVLGISAPAVAEVGHYVSGNAVDKCQAFTPGITNTIRNRVAGSENVGLAGIAVSCVFELDEIYAKGSAITDTVQISFRNGVGQLPVSVSCTLLPGTDGSFLGTASNVTTILASGGTGTALFFGPWSVYGIGVNCILPPNVTITQTIIRYRNDQV